jgi:uncharacterized coiled-coil protein SlyX
MTQSINGLKGRYGITEKKKAELDALASEIADAQFEVSQYQAMVQSLTDKVSKFQGFLADADNNRTRTLNNRNLADQLVKLVRELSQNSAIALNEMGVADMKTKTQLAPQIKKVMDRLIYSAELINKLANLVVRKKAINPLISDDLVSRLTTAGTDANNAVALTLVALKTALAAQSTNIESEAAMALEQQQANALTNLLVGNPDGVIEMITNPDGTKGVKDTTTLTGRLYVAYAVAKEHYTKVHDALAITDQQLNNATSALNKAQVKLSSLQSGFAAGNAAALAS